MKKTLVIIDINNFTYRAYYGIQQPLTAPDGTPVNAVFGVFNMLHRLINKVNPTHVIVTKDSKVSLRKEQYPEYKSNRQKMPEDLSKQIELINEMLDLMGLQFLEISGYEADDLINSLAKNLKSEFEEIYIASTDKDLMQLVCSNVFCIDTMKDKIYAHNDVIEKLGVDPSQIVDFLALLGDASDNIPGVKGVGEKTAIKLLKDNQSLDGIYQNISKLPEGKLKANLIQEESTARLSYSLAKLKDVEISLELQNFSKDYRKLVPFFTKLNIKSLLSKI
jgi:DNA polymerase-1